MDDQMNGDELNQVRETLLRRELSPAEHERLRRALSAAGAEPGPWDTEVALSSLLSRLPDAPLSSNFTARVLQAVEGEPVRAWGLPSFLEWTRAWPSLRLGASVACLLLAFLIYAHYQSASRVRMATSVARVVRSVEAASALAQLPPVEVLRDFDAIQGLSQSRVVADEELLVALKPN
jgi:hypothetical protein